jgi:hypothetical protein
MKVGFYRDEYGIISKQSYFFTAIISVSVEGKNVIIGRR